MSDKSSVRNLLIGAVLLGCFLAIGVAFRFLVYPLIQGDLIDSTGSTSQYDHEITIRLDSFSGYAPLRSPNFASDLRNQGIKLNLDDDGADYVDRLRALKRDKAQMAVFTIDALVSAGDALGSFPGTIVSVIDETYGADAVVAYPEGVPELASLNGGGFTLTPASPSEFLARVAIAEFGLQVSTRWTEKDGAADVYKALKRAKRSEKQGFVLWEPYVSQARDSGAKVLFDSSQLSGYIVDVLVVQRQFLRDHPDVVQGVVEALQRSMFSHSDDLVGMVLEDAKRVGDKLSRTQAEQIVAGIRWRNTLENYAHFGLVGQKQRGGILAVEDSISNITGVLIRTGAMSADPLGGRYNEIFYRDILSEMQRKDFHPKKKLGIVDGSFGTNDLDGVRGFDTLRELTQAEWTALTPVGSLQVKPIAFGRGNARLNVQSKRDLEEMARRLHSLPNFYLTVVGRTRSEGDVDANRALAEQRADTTRDFLVSNGVDVKRIRAEAAAPSMAGGAAQSVSFVLAQKPY
jgi:hypothetical protein